MTGGPVISARPTTSVQAAKRERADPCTMVICGALGDLSRRKLLPAIYQLMAEHLVDPDFAVLGVGREGMTDDEFRKQMREALGKSDEIKRVDDELWEDLCKRLYFVCADLTKAEDYAVVERSVSKRSNHRDRPKSATGCSISPFRRACSRRS